MAVFISASPNPVPVSTWSISQQGTTTLTWDSDGGLIGGALPGAVFVSVDSGPFNPIKDSAGNPVPAAVSGSTNHRIELGKKYLFQLKKASDPTVVLATVAVEGRELLGMPSGLLDELRKRGPLLQGITNVRVFPGIESVRIMFRTRQPTVPVVDIKRSDNQALVGAVFPFLQGPNTAHDYAFPLDQNTDFTFHIHAVPGANAVSTAKAVDASGQFRTGLRNAQVFFDHVFVHTDGDPGSFGDGDFTFGMGAGDIDNGAVLGGTQFKAGISGGDDRSINQSVTIEPAPVGLWVQVRSEEDDSFGYHFTSDQAELNFAPEGATWDHTYIHGDETEVSTVTRWFDLSGAGPMAQEIPFTLETGPRHVDYSLTCRLRFHATPGAVLQPMVKKSAKPVVRAKTVATMIAGERVAMTGRSTHVVLLAQDGGLYHAAARDRAGAGKANWTRLVSELRPPLTIVAAAEALHLLAVDDAGHVLHQVVSPDGQAPGAAPTKASSLGGAVVSPVVAAVSRGSVEMFALNAEGAVLHRSLAEGAKGEWQHIGEGVAGSLNAFTSARGEIGLVARGRNGDVMYLPWSADATRAGAVAWQSLGKAPPGALSAEGIDDVVVLGVLSDDETVHAAPWRNYPESPSKLEWKALGTVNDLISARYSLLPSA